MRLIRSFTCVIVTQAKEAKLSDMSKILDKGRKDLQEERRGLTTATRRVLGDEWDGQDIQPTHSHSKRTQTCIDIHYVSTCLH